MLGMLAFSLIFGIYIRPVVNKEFKNEDPNLSILATFTFSTSIILWLDIFAMEILIAISLVFVLPFALFIHCFSCCWPEVAKAMDEEPDHREKEHEELENLYLFSIGMSWQQLLLYIYKNNRIRLSRKENKSEKFDPQPISGSICHRRNKPICEEYKQTREKRESFATYYGTRK